MSRNKWSKSKKREAKRKYDKEENIKRKKEKI